MFQYKWNLATDEEERVYRVSNLKNSAIENRKARVRQTDWYLWAKRTQIQGYFVRDLPDWANNVIEIISTFKIRFGTSTREREREKKEREGRLDGRMSFVPPSIPFSVQNGKRWERNETVNHNNRLDYWKSINSKTLAAKRRNKTSQTHGTTRNKSGDLLAY